MIQQKVHIPPPTLQESPFVSTAKCAASSDREGNLSRGLRGLPYPKRGEKNQHRTIQCLLNV